MLKNVVSRYINRGSKVFACFLDASKAFDRVNHAILFQLMMDRKLPTAVIRFLLLWYSNQELTVRWNASFSPSINVSNGVRQGGVIFPIVFTIISYR